MKSITPTKITENLINLRLDLPNANFTSQLGSQYFSLDSFTRSRAAPKGELTFSNYVSELRKTLGTNHDVFGKTGYVQFKLATNYGALAQPYTIGKSHIGFYLESKMGEKSALTHSVHPSKNEWLIWHDYSGMLVREDSAKSSSATIGALLFLMPGECIYRQYNELDSSSDLAQRALKLSAHKFFAGVSNATFESVAKFSPIKVLEFEAISNGVKTRSLTTITVGDRQGLTLSLIPVSNVQRGAVLCVFANQTPGKTIPVNGSMLHFVHGARELFREFIKKELSGSEISATYNNLYNHMLGHAVAHQLFAPISVEMLNIMKALELGVSIQA